MWYRGDYPEYVSVADKKKNAEKAIAKMVKAGKKIEPVRIEGSKIAASFWGKAWCDHLESFSDYESRLPRGRSYVRSGAVLDLQVEAGQVTALVQGSSLYKITIGITALAAGKWKEIRKKCSGEISSVIELLQGKISDSVMKTVVDQSHGLFPSPKEISLKCSCPDWADMCKHVAAALYGVGARLDHEPELLFVLRNVDHLALIADATLPTKKQRTPKQKSLDDQDLSALFGIEVEGKVSAIKTNKKSLTSNNKRRASPSKDLSAAKTAAKKKNKTKVERNEPPIKKRTSRTSLPKVTTQSTKATTATRKRSSSRSKLGTTH